MNPKFVRFLMAAVAFGMIVAFAAMYARAFYRVLVNPGEEVSVNDDGTIRVVFSDAFIYVATLLAGLVGGVAAMIFNEQLPQAPAQGSVAPEAAPAAQPPNAGPAGGGILGGIFVPHNGGDVVFSIISIVYVSVYFLVGAAAIITWVWTATNTPELVRNLALISIGLFASIARAIVQVPRPAS